MRADSIKVTLEIRDLDPLATEDEVNIEVRMALQKEQMDLEVKVPNPYRWGLKLSVVVLSEEKAAKLEELSHLRPPLRFPLLG